MNNKKLLLYGSISAILLVVVIAVFLVRLFSPSESDDNQLNENSELLYGAIPSDAVMVLDIKAAGNFKPLISDTASFAYNLIDKNHILSDFQTRFLNSEMADNVPAIYSLHYSSKNDVSVFFAADITTLAGDKNEEAVLRPFLQKKAKRYNKTDIYEYDNSLYLAYYNNILIASTSLYVLESSIRHLDNTTSILDNSEFRSLYKKNSTRKSLYINHHQIGKLFSGVMTSGFLKYSDFFLRFASWSCFEVTVTDGLFSLKGVVTNNKEEKYNSSVIYSQLPAKSTMGEILPAQTVFALSLALSDVQGYLNANSLFLEVHKKLSGYKYKQHLAGIKDMAAPMEYVVDSLDIEEVVAAYCKFGERYEWLTFVKEKSGFDIGNMVGNMIDRDKEIPVKPYIYKGYIGSVFGGVFEHCKEESYCVIDGWQVIGPKDIVTDYAAGNANYTNLDYYLAQTPAEDFLSSEGVVKIVANLKEGQDSVMQVIKPYYGKLLNNSLEYKNFELLTVNLVPGVEDVVAEAGLYAIKMEQLPLPKPREELEQTTFIDSTIVIDNSSFELIDFTTGGKCYVEQLPNNKIRMLNGKRKGLWTIPFDTPLCGRIEQVDFFKNNKLQMLFISGDKFYLLDRVGRIVRGFPMTLPQKVVYGPKVLDLENNKDYSFMVLNEDNTISIYKLNREKIDKGITIQAPEFVKELPELKSIHGKDYFLLRTVHRLRLYGLDGREIVIKDKKRAIAADSDIEEVTGNEIKVKGVDGKEFIVDLVTGKTKKV